MALLIGVVAFGNVSAETVIEDLGEQDLQETPQKQKRPQLSPEERQARIQQKKQMMAKMESCLIMVRSHYGKHSKLYEDYIKKHPATQPDVEGTNARLAKTNSNILLSKIQAGMLTQCDSLITNEQIKELSKFRQAPEKFDSSKIGYKELVEFEFNQFDLAGMEQMNGQISQIQFTPQENKILSLIEDVSDRLNNENMKNSKKGAAVEIGFMDLSEMSAATQAFYLVGILAALAGALYVFYL